MNDEASSSTAAPLNATPALDATDTGPARVREGAEENNEPAKRLRRELLQRLEDLLLAFDLIIYAELASLYYMDVSFFRFFLRSMIQLFYLTPKPDILPDAPPMHKRPFVGAILGSNAMCLFFHLYYTPPRASETTRDYLHGGIIIDFIGQHAPTSVLHFIVLDFVVLALQMAMLTIVAKVEKLKRRGSRRPRPTDPTNPPPTRQDHDAEERGVRRSSTGSSTRAEPPNPDLEQQGELDALLGHSENTALSTEDELNDIYSGQTVIVDMHVMQTVREQYRAYQDRPVQTSSAVEQAQGLADRIALGRRLMMSAGRRR